MILEELHRSLHGHTDGAEWAAIAQAAHQLHLLATDHAHGHAARIVRSSGQLTNGHQQMANRVWDSLA